MSREAGVGALLVVAAAAWLRLHGLGEWSLDGDEYYGWQDVTSVLAGGPWPDGMRSHPLGYLGMLALAALGGSSEGMLRAFPALCGVAAVAALAWLRRDAVPRRTAVLAALLAGASPWLVYHAQTARFYGPLLLFASLATLWALPGAGRRPWAALGALGAAVLCHPSAALLGPCLLTPLCVPRLQVRRLGGVLLAAALGIALLLWLGGASAALVARALAREAPTHYSAGHYLLGLGYNLGPVLGLLALAGLWGLRRNDPRRVTLAVCAVLPPALLLVLGLTGVSMHQRYAMAAVPALVLLAAEGIARLRRPWGAGALTLALLACGPGLVAHMRDGNRHDYRAAAAWLVERSVSSSDLVVADEHGLLEHYLGRHEGFGEMRLHEAPLGERKMHSFARNPRDCWLVLKASRLDGAYGSAFQAWVEARFREAGRIGHAPPALVRHDNRLVVFHRTVRVRGG